jgi:predicted RNase H-like nuclease
MCPKSKMRKGHKEKVAKYRAQLQENKRLAKKRFQEEIEKLRQAQMNSMESADQGQVVESGTVVEESDANDFKLD